ncbi:hypothetical protein QBC46DRAFT_373918 [Diplogelasinospora grovesii]|uniref:Uncharacterized protein n=1 Tax=Diplogelasinospora grovesii TaxID=303347 RepID=A0AAN6S951_9PEZI|nr:hypothetical protein QBC46DRAFT_373918 [Diplogelasinospora grovesii]
MSSDVFRRVGRGGAGNWYSKKDVEEADKKRTTSDVEAQNPATPVVAPSEPSQQQPSVPVYARAGRGGAGNFHDPANIPALGPQEMEKEVAAVAAAKQHKPSGTGLSGRGGMGNWMGGNDGSAAEDTRRKEEDEQKMQEEVEMKVLKEVDTGLAMPPRTYHRHDRDEDILA